jgi:hypothetical protein
MRIYLDICCYGRQFDDFAQPRIAAEAVAVKAAVAVCRKYGGVIVGGFMVEDELSNIRDPDKLGQVRGYYDSAVNERVLPAAAIDIRARQLQAKGLKRGDSYHLACAETGRIFC